MTDAQTARSGEWDALELYASLLASLGGGVGDGAGGVGSLVDERVSLLVDEAVKVWSRPGFDTFLSVPKLRFTPFDYQLQAARSALRRMRGRAILADEVGLGKTIEAGLVLAELRLRGLAGRTLVITPAGLVASGASNSSASSVCLRRFPARTRIGRAGRLAGGRPSRPAEIAADGSGTLGSRRPCASG